MEQLTIFDQLNGYQLFEDQYPEICRICKVSLKKPKRMGFINFEMHLRNLSHEQKVALGYTWSISMPVEAGLPSRFNYHLKWYGIKGLWGLYEHFYHLRYGIPPQKKKGR